MTVKQRCPPLTLSANDLDGHFSEAYEYAHLLPHLSQQQYPPLTPYLHIDPGSRALKHSDPRAFLRDATSIIHLTPNLGTEVRGVQLKDLDSDGRDQVALEVRSQRAVVRRTLISVI